MKISAKLALVTISLIIVSLAAPSIMALESFSRALESQINQNLEHHGIRTIDKVSRFLFERYSDLQLLADPKNSIMTGSDFTVSEKIEYLQSVEKAYGVYSAFSIYDGNGIRIGNTHNSSLGADSSDEQYFVDAINGNIYHDSIPVFSADSGGQYVIRFSAPLLDDNGDVGGVLLGELPTSRIDNIIEETAKGIGGSVVNLLSSNGSIIYSNQDENVAMQKNLASLPIFNRVNSSGNPSESLVGPLENEDIAGSTDRFDNVASNPSAAIYVAAKEQGFLDYKGNGWILVIAVPTEIAFSQVRQLQTNFILVAILILSLSIIAVIVFSKFLTKPLSELKNSAAEIAKGNFEANTKINSNDEIGELSRQFDKMKDNLKDRERLKDEFINIAAHELRSPLQPIISYNELALKGLMDKDEALRIIDTESQRFIQLANDILDVTRIEAGALTYHMEKIKLVDIINRIVNTTKISSNLRGEVSMELILDETSKNLEIYADENRISQVFTNIIGNAVKFTSKGVIQIKVSTRLEENRVEIKISDTGGGIPSDILPNLFGKFVTRSVQGGTEHGTGLGLFISKAIIAAHKGEIYAHNNDEGNGATFTILLPISKEEGGGENYDATLLNQQRRRQKNW